ncbi:MAG: hypothetical protein JST16_02885 [Bdellovibrionales bacterium]|nr:hypothetical protein [Bdellovibrionales bacterium]
MPGFDAPSNVKSDMSLISMIAGFSVRPRRYWGEVKAPLLPRFWQTRQDSPGTSLPWGSYYDVGMAKFSNTFRIFVLVLSIPTAQAWGASWSQQEIIGAYPHATGGVSDLHFTPDLTVGMARSFSCKEAARGCDSILQFLPQQEVSESWDEALNAPSMLDLSRDGMVKAYYRNECKGDELCRTDDNARPILSVMVSRRLKTASIPLPTPYQFFRGEELKISPDGKYVALKLVVTNDNESTVGGIRYRAITHIYRVGQQLEYLSRIESNTVRTNFLSPQVALLFSGDSRYLALSGHEYQPQIVDLSTVTLRNLGLTNDSIVRELSSSYALAELNGPHGEHAGIAVFDPSTGQKLWNRDQLYSFSYLSKSLRTHEDYLLVLKRDRPRSQPKYQLVNPRSGQPLFNSDTCTNSLHMNLVEGKSLPSVVGVSCESSFQWVDSQTGRVLYSQNVESGMQVVSEEVSNDKRIGTILVGSDVNSDGAIYQRFFVDISHGRILRSESAKTSAIFLPQSNGLRFAQEYCRFENHHVSDCKLEIVDSMSGTILGVQAFDPLQNVEGNRWGFVGEDVFIKFPEEFKVLDGQTGQVSLAERTPLHYSIQPAEIGNRFLVMAPANLQPSSSGYLMHSGLKANLFER